MKLTFNNWNNFLSENKLRVFDFDDTIAKTDSKINVKTPDGRQFSMTPGEYSTHEENPDWMYDYSEFSDVINPREIKAVTKIIKNIISAETSQPENREVVILTARQPDAAKPISRFLEDIDIDPSYVDIVTLGSANPNDKKDWIRRKIKQNHITDLLFLDDSGKNVAAVEELKEEFPEIENFRVKRVSYANFIREEEEYQRLVKQKHSRLKKKNIGLGNNRKKEAPYDIDPTYKRSKSAPSLNEVKNHYEVHIYLNYERDLSLYNEIFNKIRAIDGVTVVKALHTNKKHLNKQTASIISVKFLPKQVDIHHYSTYLHSQIKKIKDEAGLQILKVEFISMPRISKK